MASKSTLDPFNATSYEDDLLSTSYIISASPNDTLQSSEDEYYEVVPVLGLGTSMFAAIHVTAFVSIAVSLTFSISLIIYICNCKASNYGKIFSESRRNRTVGTIRNEGSMTERGNKNQPGISKINPNKKLECSRLLNISTWSFWKLNISERLVVYLAISDSGICISHSIDSGWIYNTGNPPPVSACRTIAFFIEEWAFAQWVIILFSAASASLLVVRGYKLKTGMFDWRLLTAAFIGPLLPGVLAASTHLLGFAGSWCFIDLSSRRGRIFNIVSNSVILLVFLLIALSYGAIWWKIRKTEKLKSKSGGTGGGGGVNLQKYGGSIKMMMIFVLVFVLQYWALVVFNFWEIFVEPPLQMRVLTTFFAEAGGVFNVIAYTVIRKKLQSKKSDGETTEAVTHQKKEGGAYYISTTNETAKSIDGPSVLKFMVLNHC